MHAMIRPQHPFEPDAFLADIRARRSAGEEHIARALPASAALLSVMLALIGALSPTLREAVVPEVTRRFDFAPPPQVTMPRIERSGPAAPRIERTSELPARFIPEDLAPPLPAEHATTSPDGVAGDTPGPIGSASAQSEAATCVECQDADPATPSMVWREVMPSAVHVVKPLYPDLARDAQVEGTVRLWVLVGRDGGVEDVRVQQSVPMLDEAAVGAVRRWRFTPARSVDRPVRSWVSIPVRFRSHD